MHITINDSPLDQTRTAMLFEIISAGLKAANPRLAVNSVLKVKEETLWVSGLEKGIPIEGQVHLIGAGKASIPMACGVVDILGKKISGGVVITKSLLESWVNHLPGNIEVLKGNHPFPGEESLRSTQKLVEYCQNLDEKDVVICLISGGGSALMTLPSHGIQLKDIQALTGQLLKCGATIEEINTLRKHLDQVKGGGLARICSPATVLTLAISDVIGNSPAVIASGPTVPDKSTFENAKQIMDKYKLKEVLPNSIQETFKRGLVGDIPETLKPGDPIFDNCFYSLIASNEVSVSAALSTAARLGFKTVNLGSVIQGEAQRIGEQMAGRLTEVLEAVTASDAPICLIGGGETTVRIKGNGLGGRNLELALAAVKPLAGKENLCLLTLATDGEDGPTDAAGAIVTGETFPKGKMIGLDPDLYLSENDSYHYFERAGGLIRTGSTGTNVMDMIYLFRFSE
jgi:glycerate 2-kinase